MTTLAEAIRRQRPFLDAQAWDQLHACCVRVLTATGPGDHEATERAITAIYAVSGLAPPAFRWHPSPEAAIRVGFLEGAMADAGRKVVSSILSRVKKPLLRMRDRVLGAGVEFAARHPDGGRMLVIDALVFATIVALHPGQHQVRSLLSGSFPGQDDVIWVFLQEGRELLGLEMSTAERSGLACWVEAVRGCYQWWPYERCCLIAEHPSRMLLNAQLNLHADEGDALRFGDGFGVCARDGVLLA